MAKKLLGLETKEEILYNAVAKVHQRYLCTATMRVDPEMNEPILLIIGFIRREEVEKSIKKFDRSNR